MRQGTELRPLTINMVFTKGGLGDSVARLPAVAYVLRTKPHVSIRLYVQDYFQEYAAASLSKYSNRLKVLKQSELATTLDNTLPGMTTDALQHTTLRTHLTDHAFHTLADETPPYEEDKNYLPYPGKRPGAAPAIKGKYVVITTGFTAPVREWLPSEINKVATWLRSQNYGVVFLGKTESVFNEGAGANGATIASFREEIDFTLGNNLVDRTDLFQAAHIMGTASAVVGVDNGLLHLAAGSDVPIVAGYTSVDPKHRMPYRHGVLGWNVIDVTAPDNACNFCQTKLNFLYEFDFRRCFYNDYKCVEGLKAELFIAALRRVLPNVN